MKGPTKPQQCGTRCEQAIEVYGMGSRSKDMEVAAALASIPLDLHVLQMYRPALRLRPPCKGRRLQCALELQLVDVVDGVERTFCELFVIDLDDAAWTHRDFARAVCSRLCHEALEELSLDPHTGLVKEIGSAINRAVHRHTDPFPRLSPCRLT